MTGIGPRLREERQRLKLSQSALGAAGGVETNAQGNYESGARSPKVDYLLAIAEAGVDIYYVLTGAHCQTPENHGFAAPLLQPALLNGHMDKVTQQLHRNLHGLIDALFHMTRLIESRAIGTDDETIKSKLDIIRADALELAQASVRLIFVTTKLA